MPVHAVLRDSFIGTLVYFLSGRRYFRHPEELPGFVLPEKYATAGADRSTREANQSDASSQTRSVATAAADPSTSGEDSNIPQTEPASEPRNEQDADTVSETTTMRPVSDNGDLEKGANGKKQKEQVTEQPSDSEVVDWYGPDDPECPRNVRPYSETTYTPAYTRCAVVICQALLRDIRHLLADFQHLHRLRYLLTRHWTGGPAIWHL